MNTVARDQILKLGLLLALIEGWATRPSVAGRLHLQPEQVQSRADWLHVRGYIEVSVAAGVPNLRWAGEGGFEQLWGELIPDRPCPVRLQSRDRETAG